MVKTRLQVPKPVRTQLVAIGGENYTILRFLEGERPNFEETVEIARRRKGKELLKYNEAEEISENKELSQAFRKTLKYEDWTFIRDARQEKNGGGVSFLSNRGSWMSIGFWMSERYSPVIILKDIKPENSKLNIDEKSLVRIEIALPRIEAQESSGMFNPGTAEAIRTLLRTVKG